MGCVGDPPDSNCNDNEKPRHNVNVPAFDMMQTEVTNEMYAAFLNDHGNVCDGEECVDADNPDLQLSESGGVWSVDTGKELYPIMEVTWYGAKAFCARPAATGASRASRTTTTGSGVRGSPADFFLVSDVLVSGF